MAEHFVLAQGVEEGVAIHLGHHYITQDEVGALAAGDFHTFDAVGSSKCIVAFELEHECNISAHRGLIFDDEDLVGHGGGSVKEGQVNGESSATAGFTLDLHGAAVEIDTAFYNDEPKPGAGCVTDIRAAMECLEEPCTIFLRDADAMVDDIEQNLVAIAVDAQDDLAAVWRVFDGVGDEVAEDVTQQGLVCSGIGDVALSLQGDGAFAVRDGLGLVDDALSEASEIEWEWLASEFSSLRAAQQQHLLHETAHVLRAGLDLL